MPQCLCQCKAKVILPLVFKAGGNTKTITVHLRKVHYRMAIMCDICSSFTGMNTQSILDHYSGCKAKQDKEHMEHKGHEKVKSNTRRRPSPRDKRRSPNYLDKMSPGSHKERNATQNFLSSPARESWLVHSLNLSGSSQLSFMSESSPIQMNCHFFLQSQCL